MLRLPLLAFGVWSCTLLLYFAGIVFAAAVLDHADISAAETAAVMLVALEIVVACLGVAYVLSRARRILPTARRWLWVAAFVLVQFVTCALAVFSTLLVLNR